jgi:hypothetical protein
MSLHKNELISTLQQQPHLLRDYPWYPTGFFANSQQENNLQKLAAFINHPLRVHMLVSADEMAAETTTDIPELIAATETPVAAEDIIPSENETDVTTIQEVAEENINQAEPGIHEESNEAVEVQTQVDNTAENKITDETEEKPFVLPAISLPTTTDASFQFQPFHTVDYFSSLGIKVDQSNITSTRFDTQLKSFTQWLKTMKRADYQTGQFSADPAVDAQAKASLEVKEILTEAMADVLAQQGRHAQAVEVYRKLTLLHPEKTAFFAAQIEKLKASQ